MNDSGVAKMECYPFTIGQCQNEHGHA